MLILSVLIACEKPGNLGEDLIYLQDSKINSEFTDTISIIAYSVIVDSVATSDLKYNLLGSLMDNVFGATTANIYTQLRLSENNVDFGSNPICDSIVLTLDYSGFYGDSTSTQTFRIFEVTDDMYYDSTYYSNDTLDVNQNEIGIITKSFNLVDSTYYNGVLTRPHLNLPLNKSFGDKILAKSGQTELTDNESFKDFIKGILISVDKVNSDGGIAYINLMSSLSTLSLYYHNNNDTLVYKFAINEFCSYFSSFNHYSYNDANLDFKSQVVMGDTTLGNKTLYIQSLGGVKTKFYFPYLYEITKNGPIAVQNAELLISVKSGTTTDYEPVYGLAVVKLDSVGKPQFINDYFEGSAYFGGDFNSSRNNYSFNLNRYIQSIISNKENQYGLELVTKGASIYGNRLIFNGTKASDNRLRLRLTYTKAN